jgi:hypothetical protein
MRSILTVGAGFPAARFSGSSFSDALRFCQGQIKGAFRRGRAGAKKFANSFSLKNKGGLLALALNQVEAIFHRPGFKIKLREPHVFFSLNSGFPAYF